MAGITYVINNFFELMQNIGNLNERKIRNNSSSIEIFFLTLEVELAIKMIRHVAIYFSIVRLNACCASLDRRSTSVITTTLKGAGPLESLELGTCIC